MIEKIAIQGAEVNIEISGNGIFITLVEASQIQDLHILDNVIRNSVQNGILFTRFDKGALRTVNPEAGQNRAVTIDGVRFKAEAMARDGEGLDLIQKHDNHAVDGEFGKSPVEQLGNSLLASPEGRAREGVGIGSEAAQDLVPQCR